MTLKRLNELRRGLIALRNLKEEIEIRADSIPSGNSNGMPSAKGASNVKEKKLNAYLTDKEKLEKRYAKMLKEYSDTMKYIKSIEDHTTYLIFHYRFISGYSWVKVAMTIGGNNTADCVRMRVNDYLKKHK